MVALHPDESKARRPLLKIPEILWGHNGDIFIYIIWYIIWDILESKWNTCRI